MNKPLASCVCVTFDRPHLLNETLYCFLAQDYENKELIILNDQCDIQYVFDDPRVKIYNFNKRMSSLGEKREFSRYLTNGEYIVTMDDDDIYYSNHISSLVNFLETNKEYDISMHRNSHYSEWNEYIEVVHIGCPLNGACLRKDYWQNNEFSRIKSRGEDFDFVNNAIISNKVLYVDDDIITFHYRWGLDVHHISGLGGDGIESYTIVTQGTSIGPTRIIKLVPQISDKVKLYYR